MKKSLRTIVYLMILTVVAAGIYLWSAGGDAEEVLGGLDPAGFDVEATCMGVHGNNLICNKGNDTYLYLDGTKVYKQKTKTEIKENGDEETKVSYKDYDIGKLEKKLGSGEEAVLRMWLTQNGKVKAIMVAESSFENNNASLATLEGLDPSSHDSSSVILKMSKYGMKLAPSGYKESEKDKFEALIRNYKFAKNVKFYTEKVTIKVAENGNRQKNIQYGKTTYTKVKERMVIESDVYIWFNKNANISVVMVHSEKVILENLSVKSE